MRLLRDPGELGQRVPANRTELGSYADLGGAAEHQLLKLAGDLLEGLAHHGCERLLAAANELFYNEGVHTVGIDRIIEQAGVAKASLYNTFGSKDELVRAYLETRHASVTQRITQAVGRHEPPRERPLGLVVGPA